MQAVGIDLGTTNTVLAANAQVVPLRAAGDNATIMPSVVAYLPDGGIAVGVGARERRAMDAKNTIYSAKRVIGEAWHSARVREFATYYPFDIVQGADGHAGFKTRSGIKTPTEIASAVVRALCSSAGLDARAHEAVVSVPAGFAPSQRAATLRAVREAGFQRVRCVAEPVATALAYMNRTDVRRGVVYDLGGGTFDLAILDCTSDPFRIVAYGGDPYLGGDDIDHALATFVADMVLQQHGWDLRSDPQVFTRLVLEAEKAKVRLSFATSTVINLEQVDAAAPAAVTVVPIERHAVMELSAALIRRTFLVCDQVLADADVPARDVQAVFLAGGTTLVPGVREAVAQYFGQKLRHELDPMHVVSVGASIAAMRPRFANLLQES
jgi:molecular chaperone DnaK